MGEGRGDKGLKVQIDLEKMLYNVWLYLVLMKLAGCCRVMELCIIGSSYGLCGAVGETHQKKTFFESKKLSSKIKNF